MVSRRLAPAVASARAGLVRLAASSAGLRHLMARAGRELATAAEAGAERAEARRAGAVAARADPLYDGAYFGEGRNPAGDREGRSGYASYDRVSSNADIAAYLLWRNFDVARTLDVGCATGYLVEALRELGLDAVGCDASPFAVEHAAPGARGHVRLGELAEGLPFADGAFDLVSALEILEHLEPERVPAALAELRRVCRGVVYATIPSYGRNASGPDGHYGGKVRPERLADYETAGDPEGGPLPRPDLAVDADGHPIEGHLTIASFAWWTARFEEAGLSRWVDVERRLYADIEPAGLQVFWNLYVMAVPGAEAAMATPRQPDKSLRELGLLHPLLEHRAGSGAP
jgi:SAM-dependent methyltransferase